jgi:hypothetical protein
MRTPRKVRLRNNEMIGKIVVLVRDIRTKGGAFFKVGTRMRVSSTWRGKFNLYAVTKTGRDVRSKRTMMGVSHVHWNDFMEVGGGDGTSSK